MFVIRPDLPRYQRIHTGVDIAATFVASADGSLVVSDAMQQRAVRVQGRSVEPIEIFAGEYSWVRWLPPVRKQLSGCGMQSRARSASTPPPVLSWSASSRRSKNVNVEQSGRFGRSPTKTSFCFQPLRSFGLTATARSCGARLATGNQADFRVFASEGLELV